MSISFNNIPTSWRVPGAYTEATPSRSGLNLASIPRKALIVGTGASKGAALLLVPTQITTDGQADTYFGPGSQLARMINRFKSINKTTELWACEVSAGTAAASTTLFFPSAPNSLSRAGNLIFYVNGTKFDAALTSGWSGQDVRSAVITLVNQSAYSTLGMYTSIAANSHAAMFAAAYSGVTGNYMTVQIDDLAQNQNTPWNSLPLSASFFVNPLSGGAGGPSIGHVFTAVDGDRYDYIVTPFTDAANLAVVATELTNRFDPLTAIPGIAFTATAGTVASCTAFGNSLNSPFIVALGQYPFMTDPAETAAILGARAAFELNNDPARPLLGLDLPGLIAPLPKSYQFTPSERNTLYYDGISNFYVDDAGTCRIERLITTYQNNALGVPDDAWLDVNRPATVIEIMDQYRIRMILRFIDERFKLADDGNTIPAGQPICTPSTIKQEIIALFKQLGPEGAGLVENLAAFNDALRVERNGTDRNRVDVLLPPDLVDQLLMIATKVEFK